MISVKKLVPKEIWETEGEQAVRHLTPALLTFYTEIVDFMPKHFPGCEIVVNDFVRYNYRGYRQENCDVGAQFSQHKKGNAIDFDVYVPYGKYKRRIPPEQIRTLIINNQSSFTTLTRMEAGVNWVHGDCKQTGEKGIVLFKP
jgi:hypothetical protein